MVLTHSTITETNEFEFPESTFEITVMRTSTI